MSEKDKSAVPPGYVPDNGLTIFDPDSALGITGRSSWRTCNKPHNPQFSKTGAERRAAREEQVEVITNYCKWLTDEEWRRVKEMCDDS